VRLEAFGDLGCGHGRLSVADAAIIKREACGKFTAYKVLNGIPKPV
jgi:hypothetical protein